MSRAVDYLPTIENVIYDVKNILRDAYRLLNAFRHSVAKHVQGDSATHAVLNILKVSLIEEMLALDTLVRPH